MFKPIYVFDKTNCNWNENNGANLLFILARCEYFNRRHNINPNMRLTELLLDLGFDRADIPAAYWELGWNKGTTIEPELIEVSDGWHIKFNCDTVYSVTIN